MLMQSLLSARSAALGCKGSPSLAKAVTSQLLTLCRGRDVSPVPLSCSARMCISVRSQAWCVTLDRDMLLR